MSIGSVLSAAKGIAKNVGSRARGMGNRVVDEAKFLGDMAVANPGKAAGLAGGGLLGGSMIANAISPGAGQGDEAIFGAIDGYIQNIQQNEGRRLSNGEIIELLKAEGLDEEQIARYIEGRNARLQSAGQRVM